MNLDDLHKPFPPDRISWRVGSTTKDKAKGMALAYIDARDVQDRLDAVCTPGGWQNRYVPMHDKKTVCEIGVKIGDEWVWKADGAGDSDVEAEKGALSDAFKRAAVKWGIGRYLYDLDSPWVELDTYEKNGQVFAKGIKAREFAKLRALLAGNASKPNVPQQATNSAGPPTEMTPERWGNMALSRITGFKTERDLTEFTEKYHDKIAKLRPVVPEIHKQIISAIQSKNMEMA